MIDLAMDWVVYCIVYMTKKVLKCTWKKIRMGGQALSSNKKLKYLFPYHP